MELKKRGGGGMVRVDGGGRVYVDFYKVLSSGENISNWRYVKEGNIKDDCSASLLKWGCHVFILLNLNPFFFSPTDRLSIH